MAIICSTRSWFRFRFTTKSKSAKSKAKAKSAGARIKITLRSSIGAARRKNLVYGAARLLLPRLDERLSDSYSYSQAHPGWRRAWGWQHRCGSDIGRIEPSIQAWPIGRSLGKISIVVGRGCAVLHPVLALLGRSVSASDYSGWLDCPALDRHHLSRLSNFDRLGVQKSRHKVDKT